MPELDALIYFAVGELRNRRVIPPLPHGEVERIRATRNVSPGDFFDLFARRVAHDYDAGKLSFEAAGAAINSLNTYAANHYDVRLPSYAWEVFLAFDEGEYHHRYDAAQINSEEKYTRPEINSIVLRDRILGTTGGCAT